MVTSAVHCGYPFLNKITVSSLAIATLGGHPIAITPPQDKISTRAPHQASSLEKSIILQRYPMNAYHSSAKCVPAHESEIASAAFGR